MYKRSFFTSEDTWCENWNLALKKFCPNPSRDVMDLLTDKNTISYLFF